MNRRGPLLVTTALLAIGAYAMAPSQGRAGTIDLLCWNTSVVYTLEAPQPTVGCTLEWYPGGSGQYAIYVGSFPSCTPDCYVVPDEWEVAPININSPSFGEIDRFVTGNCVGQVVHVTVVASADAIFVGRGDPQVVQHDQHYWPQGSVGIWCP